MIFEPFRRVATFLYFAHQILVARLPADEHDQEEDRQIVSFGWGDAIATILCLSATALLVWWLS